MLIQIISISRIFVRNRRFSVVVQMCITKQCFKHFPQLLLNVITQNIPNYSVHSLVDLRQK